MHLTMINTLRRRRSVSPQLFYDYWRDTHVSVASRLPGIDTLWTHWVEFDLCDWPAVAGIEGDLPEEQWFDGVPEPCFATKADLALFAAGMGPLMADEANIFERTIGYQSFEDSSFTLKDETDPAPNGDRGHPAYFLFLRKRPDVERSEFRGGVCEVADTFARHPKVVKLRGHLPEPYNDTEVILDAGSEVVSHSLAAENQHQAMLEIAFSDAAGRDAFFASEDYRQTVEQQQRLFAAAHPFRITRTYTWKLGGRPTLAQVRGVAVVDQIQALRAANQLTAETLSLFQDGHEVVHMQVPNLKVPDKS